jgi:phosphatidylserine/phosphatidylglycerophosphate/cardiolipin synthase-like enzyme
MRPTYVSMAIGISLLAVAVSGCAGAQSATPEPPKPPKPALTLFVEPQTGYQPIYDFIDGATKSVDMTMYQLQDTKAQDALKAAAKRGVKVRVLLDSDISGGGSPTMNQAAYSDLSTNSVEVRWAWPGTLWHQKSITRDGTGAAIMTCNLYAPYYPIVRDFVVFTNNRATVAGMDATFERDWEATGSPPASGTVPPGSELVWSPGAQTPLVDLIDSARPGTTIWAESEQLGSPPIQQALVSAAKRGVTVNFLMTFDADWVAGLNALASGGVHVRVYQPNAPIYIHAKALTINDDTAYAGSANFTSAMTDQNRNVGIITKDPVVVRGIRSTIASDFAGAAPYNSQ